MEFSFLRSAELFIAATAVIGTIIMSVKRLYRVARNIEEALLRLDDVQSQLRPNGGFSLYDKIHALGEEVRANGEHARMVDSKMNDVIHRLEKLEDWRTGGNT